MCKRFTSAVTNEDVTTCFIKSDNFVVYSKVLDLEFLHCDFYSTWIFYYFCDHLFPSMVANKILHVVFIWSVLQFAIIITNCKESTLEHINSETAWKKKDFSLRYWINVPINYKITKEDFFFQKKIFSSKRRFFLLKEDFFFQKKIFSSGTIKFNRTSRIQSVNCLM